MSWRKIHFNDGEEEWRYKIHKNQTIEIRSPSNMKFITYGDSINKSKEFEERFDLVEEGCYDISASDDEYSIYKDKKSGELFRSCDAKFMDEWFGIKPSGIKAYIENVRDSLPKRLYL